MLKPATADDNDDRSQSWGPRPGAGTELAPAARERRVPIRELRVCGLPAWNQGTQARHGRNYEILFWVQRRKLFAALQRVRPSSARTGEDSSATCRLLKMPGLSWFDFDLSSPTTHPQRHSLQVPVTSAQIYGRSVPRRLAMVPGVLHTSNASLGNLRTPV
ncbi:hypothetical protein RRG08_024464 [Elysia crispata]|uniref:Uncharacterized protein n=1 Tax=Elysia crispata TaxID=231223 RepID=A0AAE0YP76_9GAST|nr:hypothetical protein RRG08_024464 [Elysia crispata]